MYETVQEYRAARSMAEARRRHAEDRREALRRALSDLRPAGSAA